MTATTAGLTFSMAAIAFRSISRRPACSRPSAAVAFVVMGAQALSSRTIAANQTPILNLASISFELQSPVDNGADHTRKTGQGPESSFEFRKVKEWGWGFR